MKIFGLDFTSAPSAKKPITCAECAFDETARRLVLVSMHEFPDFAAFEDFLQQPGPWVAGIDFPFSQPQQWLKRYFDQPSPWCDYVKLCQETGFDWFSAALTQHRLTQPKGQKHYFRVVDRRAKACSPMMLHYIPVGRMFFQSAPRLLQSGVHIPNLHPGDVQRVVVEAYPALIPRNHLHIAQGYKSDSAKLPEEKRNQQLTARRHIVASLKEHRSLAAFEFILDFNAAQAQRMIDDNSGDRLDAFLCAIQATWAYTQRANGYGVSETEEAKEGWIADPSLLKD